MKGSLYLFSSKWDVRNMTYTCHEDTRQLYGNYIVIAYPQQESPEALAQQQASYNEHIESCGKK